MRQLKSVQLAGDGPSVQTSASSAGNSKRIHRKIHPVVIYPYVFKAEDIIHIDRLYEELGKLRGDDRFEKPLTVADSQTRAKHEWSPDFQHHMERVKSTSTLVETESIDTCHRWLVGLKRAYDLSEDFGRHKDIFWLIPGDFMYGDKQGPTGYDGDAVLTKMFEIPLMVRSGQCDLCLGEIQVSPNGSKQLIDTYGTYGLLYNWFPVEAQTIALKTSKPRSEFFALDQELLRRAMFDHRWFAYEQTLAILLQNMSGTQFDVRVETILLGKIDDDPSLRNNLSDALAQVDRTERMLKMIWRKRYATLDLQNPNHWVNEYKKLDSQSSAICTSALVILERTLKGV